MDEVARHRLSPAGPDHDAIGSDTMEDAAPGGLRQAGPATRLRPADDEDPIFGRSAALRRLARDLGTLHNDPDWACPAPAEPAPDRPAASADAVPDTAVPPASRAARTGSSVEHEAMSLAELDQAIDGLSRRLAVIAEPRSSDRVVIDRDRLAQLKALARTLANELDQLPELEPEEPTVPAEALAEAPPPPANSLAVPSARAPQAPALDALPEFPPLPDFPPLPETASPPESAPEAKAAAVPLPDEPEPSPQPAQPAPTMAAAPMTAGPITAAPMTVAPMVTAPMAPAVAVVLEPVAPDAVPPNPSAEDRPDWSAIRVSDMPRTEHRGSIVLVGAVAAAVVLLSGAVAVDHLWLSGHRVPAHPAIALAAAHPSVHPSGHPVADTAGRAAPSVRHATSKAGVVTPQTHPETRPAHPLAAATGPVAPADATATSESPAGTVPGAGARPPAVTPTPPRVAAARLAVPLTAHTAGNTAASTPPPAVAAARNSAGPAHADPAGASVPRRAPAGATEPGQPPIRAAAPAQPAARPLPARFAAASVARSDAPLAPARAAPAIPAPTAAAVAAPVSPPVPPVASSAAVTPTPTPAPTVPTAALKPVGSAAMPTDVPVASPIATPTASPTGTPTGTPAAPPAPMVVRFTGNAWIQVLSPAGKVVFSRLMHAGESWTPPAHGLLLTTGNAGATELVVNGVASPPLGAAGAVRHMIPLDPPRPAG